MSLSQGSGNSGVLWELAKLKVLPPPQSPGAIKLAGASAGSLAIATYACGLDVDNATEALFAFAADCRAKGTRGRLGGLLQDFLHTYLPDDAHERCRDLTYVSVTKVFPVWQPQVVHRFHDKDDLVQSLITSCHIPYYANGQFMTKFRGKGSLAKPSMSQVVKLCCFPVNQALARVQPSVQGYKRVASMLDVAISPDTFDPDWQYTYAQLLNWALVPAEDKVLAYLIEKGRSDGRAWAQSMQLVEGAELRQPVAPSPAQTQKVPGSAAAEERIAAKTT
ncbi:patatin [Haematococcus lacustris]|uniref:Patatin n=1 Tax=Haematococcus lacustris TaxID=44745 RepID=A0A6A0A8D7_HAELA|nr:patatin [Haematococcus lacustris]